MINEELHDCWLSWLSFVILFSGFPRSKCRSWRPRWRWRTSKNMLFLHLTPASQMEVGCSGTWGLVPPTQTRVGRTPHKPALPATQLRAPPANIQPQAKHPSHTEQEFNGKTKTTGRGGRGNTKNTQSTKTPWRLSKVNLWTHMNSHA